MLELARREGGGPVKVADIADARAVPARFLEAILLELRHGGMVDSRRGAGGGYWLARPAEQITVGDVVRLVDGPFSAVPGDEPSATGRSNPSSPAFQGLWSVAIRSLTDTLDGATLKHLAEADRAGFARGESDFAI